MTGLEFILPAIGAATTLVGSVVQGDAQAQQAKSAAAAQQAQAAEAERKAREDQAVATRDAASQEKKATLANSRALALAASSGGGASDPTVLNLMGNTAGQGEYNALSSLYNGDSQASGLDQQAAIDRWKAKQQLDSIPALKTASLLSGVSSFASAASKVKFG